MDKKHMAVRFGMLEFVYWCIYGSFGSYISTFALSKGFSQSNVSMMLAGYYIFGFFGQFVWGSAADKLRTNKKVFIVGTIIGWSFMCSLYFADNILLFAALYCMMGFMLAPMGPMLETWLLKSIRYDSKLYGYTRSMGSLSFAICMFIMGRAIKNIGFQVMPVVSGVVMVTTIILALTTKELPAPEGTEAKGKISLKDIMSIMRIPIYLLVLVMCFCIGVSIAPPNNLKILLMETVGGDISSQGTDSFVGCAAQFALFFITGAVTGIQPRVRILLGTLGITIAHCIYYFAAAPWMVMSGTFLMFGCYGLLMPAMREIVARNVDFKYQTTANGLIDGLYGSLSGAVALMFAGRLAENYGMKNVIMIVFFVSLVPLLLITITLLTGKKDHRRIEK